MRDHYLKAMSYSFKESDVEKKLVQHIALSYLRGNENLSENSLFGILLNKWNYSHIKEAIYYFWGQKNHLVKPTDKDVQALSSVEIKKIKNRIIKFLKWLYEKYKDKESLNKHDKKILSASVKLAVFLLKIDDENIDWLMLFAPYAHIDFNSPSFI